MNVLLKVGRRAGECIDVRTDCALLMIADGRAADPRLPVEESPLAQPTAARAEIKLLPGRLKIGKPR